MVDNEGSWELVQHFPQEVRPMFVPLLENFNLALRLNMDGVRNRLHVPALLPLKEPAVQVSLPLIFSRIMLLDTIPIGTHLLLALLRHATGLTLFQQCMRLFSTLAGRNKIKFDIQIWKQGFKATLGTCYHPRSLLTFVCRSCSHTCLCFQSDSSPTSQDGRDTSRIRFGKSPPPPPLHPLLLTCYSDEANSDILLQAR